MRIEKIRALCGQELGYERNERICGELGWVDQEMIDNVDKGILNSDRKKNPLENMDEILSGNYESRKGGNGDGFCNTWPPFGTPANKIYPRFLAVCRGNKKLGTVMDKVLV